MREFNRDLENLEAENENERPEGRRCHRRMHGCGPRGMRPHMPMERPKPEEIEDLETLMMISGHILRHKRHHRFGMTQDRILRTLVKEGEWSQKDLQEHLRVRPGSISEIVRKMEEKGLVERTREEEDRRMAKIVLTEEGKRLAEQIPAEMPKEDAFACLSEEEKETMKTLLRKVLTDWESRRPQKPEE